MKGVERERKVESGMHSHVQIQRIVHRCVEVKKKSSVRVFSSCATNREYGKVKKNEDE
jgi:hypothetical protein